MSFGPAEAKIAYAAGGPFGGAMKDRVTKAGAIMGALGKAKAKKFSSGSHRQHWRDATRKVQTTEGGIPFSGVAAKDKYIKEVRDKDLDRRDRNTAAGALAGAAAGALMPGKLGAIKKAAIGAGVGAAGVLGIRRATEGTKDVYGERSRGAKRAEGLPIVAGGAAAGILAARKMKLLKFAARPEKPDKDKRGGLSPYVTAGASGALSGALIGAVPLLKRGVKMSNVGRSMAGSALLSGAVVGGGSYIGSKILGDPKEREGSAFTKRAALGGAIVGTAAGAGAGLALKKIPALAALVKKAGKEWRPAAAMSKAGTAKATAIGAGIGGAYGAFQGADEGQQVDSIRNLRKDLKK